jgi:hypothetical protein
MACERRLWNTFRTATPPARWGGAPRRGATPSPPRRWHCCRHSGSLSWGAPHPYRTSPGSCANQQGAPAWSPRVATVSSAATGIQTDPTGTARGHVQPDHQPCPPDWLQPAAGASALWGRSPWSRGVVGHTPPPGSRAVLSPAPARPCLAHGGTRVPTCRPQQPSSPGRRGGRAARRRSQGRREGKRPGSSRRARHWRAKRSSWLKNANPA